MGPVLTGCFKRGKVGIKFAENNISSTMNPCGDEDIVSRYV